MGNFDCVSYEWIDLPSRGYCYPSSSPLRKGKIALYRTTAKDVETLSFLVATIERRGDIEKILKEQMQNQLHDSNIDLTALCKSDFEKIVLYNQHRYLGDLTPIIIDEQIVTLDFTTALDCCLLTESDKDGHFSYVTSNGSIIKYKLPTFLEEYGTFVSFDNNIYERIYKMIVSINGNAITDNYIQDYNEIDFTEFFYRVTCLCPTILCDICQNNKTTKITYTLF